jgi:hypothetical protein
VNYAADMDRLVAEYTAASRSVLHRFLEVDARTTQAGTQLFEQLREELLRKEEEQQHPGTPVEATVREAQSERERLLREMAERQARKPLVGRHGREEYVLPTDWTDADEARAEGYGPPQSWLS